MLTLRKVERRTGMEFADMRASRTRRGIKDWQQFEKAASGLIYGAIMVLSVLMALDGPPKSPFQPALLLFGSILAIVLARSFSDLLSHGLETSERVLTRQAFRLAWQGSHPILTVANVPTVLFIAAGFGWLSMDTAMFLSQAFCLMVLVSLGARMGWVIDHSWKQAIGSAVFAGSIGLGLAVLKYVIH